MLVFWFVFFAHFKITPSVVKSARSAGSQLGGVQQVISAGKYELFVNNRMGK